MRCRLIAISNANYAHCSPGLSDTRVAEVLGEDARAVERAFRQRFGSESVEVRLLSDLKRGDMDALDRRLEDLATPPVNGEQPFIQDGDLVVLWVAGYGMSFRERGGAVLLPVDVGSNEAPQQHALADECGIMTKILRPVRKVNQAGVVHLVMNLFHLPFDYTPVLDSSCIGGANVYILASLAPSPQLLCGGSGTSQGLKATSTLCRHYCRALSNGKAALEDVCQEAIHGVCSDSAGVLVPKVLHCLARPSLAAAASRMAAFIWKAAGPAEVQLNSSGAAPGALCDVQETATRGRGGLAFYGSNVLGLPAAAAPMDEWRCKRRRCGPSNMRVGEIRVENKGAQVFQMPTDDALRKAMHLIAEHQDFVGFAMGPDHVEIYESRPEFEKTLTLDSHWDLHLRQPGLQCGMLPRVTQVASAGWSIDDVNRGKAVCSSEVPVASLTFVERHHGFIAFEDNSFLAALRLVCDEKGLAAASVRIEREELVEVHPPKGQRKSSSIHGGERWCPTGFAGEWLLLDLGEAQLVRGILIQGGEGLRYYNIREVKVECGDELNNLRPICDSSGCIARMAATRKNNEADERISLCTVKSWEPLDFPRGPVVARYVKVWPNDIAYPRVGVRVQKGRTCEVRLYGGGPGSRRRLLDGSVEDARSTLYVR